jgi:hypothetical protein
MSIAETCIGKDNVLRKPCCRGVWGRLLFLEPGTPGDLVNIRHLGTVFFPDAQCPDDEGFIKGLICDPEDVHLTPCLPMGKARKW